MNTPHIKFRLGEVTRAALDRIADHISALKDGQMVTRTDVFRWLIALHDPQAHPDLTYTALELRLFPAVPEPGKEYIGPSFQPVPTA
jgi:hypothetical protein